MKKNVLLCVDVITRLQEDAHMKVGKNYKGMLVMTDENEKMEFYEQVRGTSERNPIIWRGRHINVHRNKDGHYSIQLRKTELTGTLDPCTFTDEMFLDVERAKVELGL